MKSTVLCIFSFFLVSTSIAANNKHFTSAAVGISHPGLYSGLFGIENPAGIARIESGSFGLVAQAGSSFDSPSYSAVAANGDDNFGFSLGATVKESDDFSEVDLRYAVAANTGTDRIRVGIAGSSISSTNNIDVGVLIQVFESLTFGAIGFGISDNPEDFGAGLTFYFSDTWLLTADVLLPKGGSNTYWGAITYAGADLEVSVGARQQGSSSSGDLDFVANVGKRFSSLITGQYSYNVDRTHFLNLIFTF